MQDAGRRADPFSRLPREMHTRILVDLSMVDIDASLGVSKAWHHAVLMNLPILAKEHRPSLPPDAPELEPTRFLRAVRRHGARAKVGFRSTLVCRCDYASILAMPESNTHTIIPFFENPGSQSARHGQETLMKVLYAAGRVAWSPATWAGHAIVLDDLTTRTRRVFKVNRLGASPMQMLQSSLIPKYISPDYLFAIDTNLDEL